MKHTLSIQNAPIGSIKLASRTLSLVLVLATFSILALSVASVARGAAPTDATEAFNTFNDFFPGQWVSISDLEQRGFTCREGVVPSPADVAETCQKALENTPFSQLNISVWDGVVVWLNFNVRENTLTAGDLALAYGTPEITAVHQGVTLQWPEAQVSASGIVQGDVFSYLMPLSQVSMRST